MPDIAQALGVSKSSVSLWTRDVEFVPRPHQRSRKLGPNALQRRRTEEIERLVREGRERIGTLTDQEFLVAGVALYAGEGGKEDGEVLFSNSDPRMVLFFCCWLRRFFVVDESRLRLRLYLHQGLDLEAATAFWSELTNIPITQFHKAYRAVPDPSIRRSKHPLGCVGVRYCCARTHRTVMGLVHGLLSCEAIPG